MAKIKIFLSGPDYHPEERRSLEIIAGFLEKEGYSVISPTTHGFQGILMEFQLEGSGTLTEEEYKQAIILSFALDYFNTLS